MPRVAVFAPNMARGGAERGALRLADGLGRRGFDADLVLGDAVGPRLAEVGPSVRLVDLGGHRVLGSCLPLARYLRRERPVALASVLDHANVVALWAARLARFQGRVVVIEQNTLSEAARNGKNRRDRAMPRLVRRFYPWADHVVGVSQGVCDDLVSLAGLDPARVSAIANPIVGADIAERITEDVDAGWFAEAPVLVAAGRLRPQKDFGLLLEAFARLRERHDARLLVLGEGSERAALERLALRLGVAGDVRLPGAVDNPYAYIARSRAFVLSSRWEGLPTVLIEALRCGVPVIATDCPSGPQEILKGGRYGALVPVGDAAALAEAMEAAVEGRIPAPPEASWRRYDVDAVVERYVDLFTDRAGALA